MPLALVCGLVLLPVGGAAADEEADCQQAGGIYVYIFYESSQVTAGCTHAQTGYARIAELTTVAATSSGFICRIADRPETCTEPDGGTQVYWTYWWWRDDAWLYATEGGGYRGVPGSVEAWHYSAGEMPPVEPTANGRVSPAATADTPRAAPAGSGPGPGSPATTIVTLAVVLLGGLGYFIWHRRQRRG